MKEKKKIKVGRIILIVLAFYILAVGAAAVWLDKRHAEIRIYGDENVTVEYGSSYTDPGAKAVTTGNIFGDGKNPLELTTEKPDDMSELGTYRITYSAEYRNETVTAFRTVTVVDTIKPQITLLTDGPYNATVTDGYTEPGYTAADNHDGDITSSVKVLQTGDVIYYTVEDSSGNSCSAERKIEYEPVPPGITLLGKEHEYRTASLSYTDSGYIAKDGDGSDITELVTIEGEVTPYLAGDYELIYTVESPTGLTAEVHRTVTIEAVETPKSVGPENKVIYLTFDDGPGPYTSELLDILKYYGVKATFFVTNQFGSDYRDLIGRAYNEGHAIGIHTYSHDYSYIYSSEEAFFEDFMAMQEIVRQQTGSYTRLYRFPGGSSNTVSAYNPGIISRLVQALTDLGYKYYDWHVVSGDAGETTKTSVVVENVTTGIEENWLSYSVVLQHDIKDFSVDAVEDIIIWGLENGYEFRACDITSPTAHHGINN